MRFISLGNSNDIGASCHFLGIGESGLVLDAGADPNAEGPKSLPRFDEIRQRNGATVGDALVTHAHHDHIGALPGLVEEFPFVQIHLTQATRALAEYVLPASARLQRRKYEEGSSPYPPLFDEEDVDALSYLYSAHAYDEPFELSGGEVSARFLYSGHILGAAGVVLTFREKGRQRRLFYSSDTCVHAQTIIPGGQYPERPIDVLVLESTLGADAEAELITRKSEEKRLLAALKAVLARGGAALMPVFMLGRAQEMLALIDRFKRNGHIASDVPVYTAGGLRAVSSIYDATRYDTPRLDEEFQVFNVEQQRVPRGDKAKRRALKEPSIHVVASGMMFENTLSNRVAQQLVESEKNAIFLVGFAKEDSPAGLLLEAVRSEDEGIVFDRRVGMQPLKCEVQRFRFSGHSHRRDLIQLVDSLRPRTVVLVHGEASARAWMADHISASHPEIEVLTPHIGAPVEV